MEKCCFNPKFGHLSTSRGNIAVAKMNIKSGETIVEVNDKTSLEKNLI